MATPDNDGFTLVKGGRQGKKQKAGGSPLFHILNDVDPKFNSVIKLMSKLRQFHLSLRVSNVQELQNSRFLVIRDTPRDVAILQSDNKMNACLGQNVSASLPKAYQTAKAV